jgi:hypothetical protein
VKRDRRTLGAVALSKRAAADVAQATGASESTARRWSSGARAPSSSARTVLLERFGIPVDDWTTSATKRNATGAKKKTAAASHTSAVAVPSSGATIPTSAVHGVRHQLAVLEKELQDATGRERVAIHGAMTNAWRLYSRLSGELAVSEASIVRSPAWNRIVSAFAEALKKMPHETRENCARVLADVFRRHDREGT